MRTIRIGERSIGKGAPCFIIAEAGVNHDGSFEKAKQLVDIAKASGADAVKFQTWVTENICLKETKKAEYQTEQTGEGSQYEMIKRLELSFDDFAALKAYSDEQGILFLSTPDDAESANFLVKLGIPAIKIGSGELNNLLYLRYLAQFKKPLILSTGTGTMEEVRAAIEAIKNTGNEELVVLHCTTDYPTRLEDVNLRAMESMRDALHLIVGYSDHTAAIDVPVVARALGAAIIEKHYTYDKKASGPDHAASLDPEELAEMVARIRALDTLPPAERLERSRSIPGFDVMLGSVEKRPTSRERANKSAVRKSIVAKEAIKAGNLITEEMLIMKRAGGQGLPANEYARLVGKRARRDLARDALIGLGDVHGEGEEELE